MTYTFPGTKMVSETTLILDSAMDKDIALTLHYASPDATHTPEAMPKSFRIEGLSGGAWETIRRVENNHQRQVHLPVAKDLDGVRFVLEDTWGGSESRVYGFYLT
ncbi:MAG: hypothetical protein NTU83_09035 [Candidatus Hydrogenedentes bacterium]|nr:hypothetical protein [Candidatus Hydrogenedentota bacterium]